MAGVPLVYESFDWKHGVLMGAGLRSEATAAAEHSGKQIMNDPFASEFLVYVNLRFTYISYIQKWAKLTLKVTMVTVN